MPSKLASQIGFNLKQERTQRNLTQEKLALKAEVSTKTIWRIESGEVSPDIETLSKIAEVLDVPFDVLIQGIEPVDYVRQENEIALLIEKRSRREKQFILRLLRYILSIIEDLDSRA